MRKGIVVEFCNDFDGYVDRGKTQAAQFTIHARVENEKERREIESILQKALEKAGCDIVLVPIV